jgi:two-component sensor histidine kinase
MIDFEGYIRDLAENLLNSFGADRNKITVDIDISEKHLGIGVAIPCALIVNELVSNSLKYAFPENMSGKIEIILRSINEDFLELIVGDSGVGLPDSFNENKEETLGIKLVTTLAEKQLNGTFKLDQSEKTRYTIRFSKKLGD